MPEDIVFFVQQRCGKSGAPVALSRLLGHPMLRPLHPVLLTSTTGWLTEACRRMNVPFLSMPFPGSRSLWGRLLGNHLFAHRVHHELQRSGFRPRVVIGNDHLEGLLTQAIARIAKIPSAIFVRSSETTRRDFLKYHCNRASRIFVVHEEMRERVLNWSPQSEVRLIPDGVDASDFLPPKRKAGTFPRRVLVVGSEKHDKGWQDFAAALDILETDPSFPVLDFDFTGRAPDSPMTNMYLEKPRRSRLNFIGRHEDFQKLIRQYDLVIHPSREEAFGLAMVETLAAGVPMISSRAGVIEKIQTNPHLLFPPKNPQKQADTLCHLWKHWPEIDFCLESCQKRIREQFLLEDIATNFAAECRCLID